MFLDEQELKRFPSLQSTIAGAAYEALERFREEAKKTVARLVDMESSYLTVDFFRRLPQEIEKTGNQTGGNNPRENTSATNIDRYAEGHFRRIGTNVSSYIHMVSETLKNSIPKAVVYCQVKEAKQNLLNYFYTQIGKREVILTLALFQLILLTSTRSELCYLYKCDMCAWQGKQLLDLLDEDPTLMERRQQCAKRLELYKKARDEIDSVAWAL